MLAPLPNAHPTTQTRRKIAARTHNMWTAKPNTPNRSANTRTNRMSHHSLLQLDDPVTLPGWDRSKRPAAGSFVGPTAGIFGEGQGMTQSMTNVTPDDRYGCLPSEVRAPGLVLPRLGGVRSRGHQVRVRGCEPSTSGDGGGAQAQDRTDPSGSAPTSTRRVRGHERAGSQPGSDHPGRTGVPGRARRPNGSRRR